MLCAGREGGKVEVGEMERSKGDKTKGKEFCPSEILIASTVPDVLNYSSFFLSPDSLCPQISGNLPKILAKA